MADPLFITISARTHEVRVYTPGSAIVRTAHAQSIDTDAKLSMNHQQAAGLVDAVAAATGYYPCVPDLEAQRTQIRQLADQLRRLRAGADPEGAALAELALSRHIGHLVADAALLLHHVYDGREDRTVQEMLSELALMIEAMQFGRPLTNPEERATAHNARIQELRQHLPRTGPAPHA